MGKKIFTLLLIVGVDSMRVRSRDRERPWWVRGADSDYVDLGARELP